jgi:hypothetical protein
MEEALRARGSSIRCTIFDLNASLYSFTNQPFSASCYVVWDPRSGRSIHRHISAEWGSNRSPIPLRQDAVLVHSRLCASRPARRSREPLQVIEHTWLAPPICVLPQHPQLPHQSRPDERATRGGTRKGALRAADSGEGGRAAAPPWSSRRRRRRSHAAGRGGIRASRTPPRRARGSPNRRALAARGAAS